MSQANVVIPPAEVVPPVVAPTPATPAAPAPVVAPAAVAPTAPAVPVAAQPLPAVPDGQAGDPNWLKPRLQREREVAFKAAGFESEADAKAAATALKAQREAEKATTQKLTERETELATVKTRTQQLEDASREYAARMMIGLTADQKKAVADLAGDDPAAQIKAIGVLTPTWAAAAPAVVPVVAAAPAVPAPAPAAANSAPGRTAPTGTDTSPTNHKSQYATLANSNPFQAAQYGLEHSDEVYKTTPA